MNDGMISIVQGEVRDVRELEHQIPEFHETHSLAELESRLSSNGYVWKAVSNDHMVGIKAGYPLTSKIFYSWIGGILPEYRRHHIAQKLLDAQESWVQAEGYHQIQVKTMNLFKPMIFFLLKNNYLISGYEDLGDPAKSKIVFTKNFYP